MSQKEATLHNFDLPQDKGDIERLEPLIRLGYPAVEPILPDLLEWLMDANWPINQTLVPFLETIGLPLAPHIRTVLQTDDGTWKYWVLLGLVRDSAEIADALKEELIRVAECPTPDEAFEELPEIAREILEKYHLR